MNTIHSLRFVLLVSLSVTAAACSASTLSPRDSYLDARLDRSLSRPTGPTDARVARR